MALATIQIFSIEPYYRVMIKFRHHQRYVLQLANSVATYQAAKAISMVLGDVTVKREHYAEGEKYRRHAHCKTVPVAFRHGIIDVWKYCSSTEPGDEVYCDAPCLVS